MARAQTQKKTNIIVSSCLNNLNGVQLKHINLVNLLKKKILAYSAIKISANPPEPYSMLNPETSSDSPSEKSKGVRLVSAKQEIIQNITINGVIMIRDELIEWKIKVSKL